MIWKAVLAGDRVGRLVATRTRQRGDTHIEARCDCGTEHRMLAGNWSKTQSCGCLSLVNKTMRGAVAAFMNVPCDDPTHEREPDPKYSGTDKGRCRTCLHKVYRDSAKKGHVRDRQMALAAYGNKCACCSELREVFLTIDHIAEDGAAHRRELANGRRRSGSSRVTYRWLRQNNYPSGFQILCFNCNYAKHRLGECPHETERKDRDQLAR